MSFKSISSALLVAGTAFTLAACQTTTANQPQADTSIVTGSINGSAEVPAPPGVADDVKSKDLTAVPLSPVPQPKPVRKPVKTAALGGAATATQPRTKSLSLSFPKNGYTLSGDQNDKLASFVKRARANKKRVQVIGIATPSKGKKT